MGGHEGEEWKQKLMTYNLEDCAALKRVTELVYAVVDLTPHHRSGDTSDRRGQPVARVEEVEQVGAAVTGGESISSTRTSISLTLRYFDYQRERVYRADQQVLRKN